MDLALFKVFQAIAAEGSFSRAGQKLHRTQPAISLALRRLERDLGVLLVDRSGRSGRLTDAGREVAEYARRFESLEREMRVALSDLQDRRRGKLTVGANESTALYLLGHVEAYRRLHPGISVELRRSLSSRLPQAVLDGELELGAISYDPGDPRLSVQQIYDDRLTFVVSPSHRLAGRRRISIQELGQETFIAHNVVSPYRARVIETFRRHEVALNMRIEMPTIETIRRLVQRGLGVSFLPQMCVERQIDSGALRKVEVRELTMERKIRLIFPRSRELSQASRAFLELVGEGQGTE
ncbi:MAG: LysR family transcriptional regulator [Bryobacterales bacterium]|nr:LysR family transcriptional regulator [Bryobacterales bacterium]